MRKATSVLLFVLLLAIPALVLGEHTEVWRQVCESGDYEVIELNLPVVEIVCYEEVVPPPPPPDGNHLLNPIFEGTHNSTVIPGWVNYGDGEGNEYVISYNAVRLKNPTSTGYAIKWGDKAHYGDGEPDVSGFIYQDVDAQGRIITVGVTAMNVRVVTENVNIYGQLPGSDEWTLIWVPFTVDDFGTDWRTYQLSTIVDADYEKYRFEFECAWPSGKYWGACKAGDVLFFSE